MNDIQKDCLIDRISNAKSQVILPVRVSVQGSGGKSESMIAWNEGTVFRQRLQTLSISISVNDEIKVNITCVSMGNPHCIVFVDDVNFVAFDRFGNLLENHKMFPERTNVEFVNVVDASQIQMRVWERGVGQTLACGTGACASVVACVLNNKTNRNIDVILKGGILNINWDEKDNCVYMTGPAEFVFEGEWNL